MKVIDVFSCGLCHLKLGARRVCQEDVCVCWVLQEYERLTKAGSCHPDTWTFLGCCYFMLGMYPEADKVSQKGNLCFDSSFCM